MTEEVGERYSERGGEIKRNTKRERNGQKSEGKRVARKKEIKR